MRFLAIFLFSLPLVVFCGNAFTSGGGDAGVGVGSRDASSAAAQSGGGDNSGLYRCVVRGVWCFLPGMASLGGWSFVHAYAGSGRWRRSSSL